MTKMADAFANTVILNIFAEFIYFDFVFNN